MTEERIMEYDDQKNESKTAKDQQKEDMAKVYGINLSDIEEVILPNGKEYFKFYNPENKTVRMIENRVDGKNLSQQFKEIQEKLGFSQGIDERENAKAIFDYQLKYNNIELDLIPIHELKNNKQAYKSYFDGLDVNVKRAIRVLLENMDYLELEYINIENVLGIDKNRNVIRAEYDTKTGNCKLVAAEIRKYETDKINIGSSDGYTFEISDLEFDEAIENIDVASDDPIIIEEEEITGIERKRTTIAGRDINLTFAVQAYKYPEIIEKSEMSDIDKYIYRGIAAAITRKKKRNLTKGKQYLYKKQNNINNKQAAFIDSILLSLMLGFFSGIVVALVLLTIKMNI